MAIRRESNALGISTTDWRLDELPSTEQILEELKTLDREAAIADLLPFDFDCKLSLPSICLEHSNASGK